MSHSPTDSEIISFDAGLRMDGLLVLDLWAWSLKCWERIQRVPKPTQACTRETGVKTQITPKIKQVLDQNVDLSNIDQVPSNAHLSEKESQLYIFEDKEAVIKMIIKGRSPTMRHVSRTDRVALLFDRINLDPKVQIKYVDSRKQLADTPTKGMFTGDEWHNLLHLFERPLSQPCVSFLRKAVWNVETISGKLFTWITNGESESMPSRFATMRICGTRLFE